ncbi:MAG: hypothetical protein K2X94_04460 [Amoebophilaceae bacterium]|nr:hypothetical protein [Amoebophilaceae bacterium]
MKITSRLLVGLLITNSLTPAIYADPNETIFGEGEEKNWFLEEEEPKTKKEPVDTAAPMEISGDIGLAPAVKYQDGEWELKNGISGKLTLKRKVPVTPCGKYEAALALSLKLTDKEVKLAKATATIAKCITIGYGSSIFVYEKSHAGLYAAPSAAALQIKFKHKFNAFHLGYSVERPVALKLGLFDKTKISEEDIKQRANKVDDVKDKKRAFQVTGDFPAVGLSVGVVNDALNYCLSGLARYSNYTHDPKAGDKPDPNQAAAATSSKDTHYLFTWGANLGLNYQVVPDQCSFTVQGFYVHGLGDYIAGAKAIQSDPDREEMCAAYYVDKKQHAITPIDMVGGGGMVEFSITPKIGVDLSGSYIKVLGDDVTNTTKPGDSFQSTWHGDLGFSYKLHKHLSISAGYGMKKEYTVVDKKSEGLAHSVSGGINFSF